MAFDEALADRISAALKPYKGVEGKLMFGGIVFMLNGRMCCGVVKDYLMARVGPERYAALLKKPGARPMDFTGRPMKGFLFVDARGIKTGAALKAWVEVCADFALSQPPGAKKSKPAAKPGFPIRTRARKR